MKARTLRYLLGWPLVNYWNRRLDGHIAVADSAARTVRRYVRANYRIIPNGVNFDRFADRQPVPHHLTDERPVVLYAGRIESRKGIPHLLKAFQRSSATSSRHDSLSSAKAVYAPCT